MIWKLRLLKFYKKCFIITMSNVKDLVNPALSM